MAHNLDPVVYIGKFGGCDLAAKAVANEMADKLGAEFVQAIGHKFTLYRESKENKQIVLPR